MTQQFLLENLWLIGAALLSGGMLVWHSMSRAGSSGVSPARVVALMNQRKAVLVDIRDDKTIAEQGSVSDARRIDMADLKAQADKIAKNKATPVVALCQSGQRSSAAVTVLKAAGYTEVYAMEGGFDAWREAGLPIKRAVANA